MVILSSVLKLELLITWFYLFIHTSNYKTDCIIYLEYDAVGTLSVWLVVLQVISQFKDTLSVT